MNQFELSGTNCGASSTTPKNHFRATDPRAWDGQPAAPRNYYLLTQSVKIEFDPAGIPQDGPEWTAREEHVRTELALDTELANFGCSGFEEAAAAQLWHPDNRQAQWLPQNRPEWLTLMALTL